MAIRRGRRLKSWLNRKFNDIKRATFFNIWHTGSTPLVTENINVKELQTRRRKKLKIKKLIAKFFTVPHNGENPNTLPAVIKFQSHKRKVKVVKKRRKDTSFPLFHFVQPPVNNSNVVHFQAHSRKKRKSKLKRKDTYFKQWFTGSTPPININENVIKFQTRRRKVEKVKPRRKSNFFIVPHTGLTPPLVPQFEVIKTRKQHKLTRTERKKQLRIYGLMFTGAEPPPPPIGETKRYLQVKLKASKRRGF